MKQQYNVIVDVKPSIGKQSDVKLKINGKKITFSKERIDGGFRFSASVSLSHTDSIFFGVFDPYFKVFEQECFFIDPDTNILWYRNSMIKCQPKNK